MNRLVTRFKTLRQKKEGALITYFPIGEPGFDTMGLAETYIGNGADLLEIALPVNDPSSDGPVVAQSMERVREVGRDLDWLFNEIFKIRNAYPDMPLQIFSYMQIFNEKALDEVAVFCKQAQVDAMLFPDASEEQIQGMEESFGSDLCSLRFMPFRCEMSDIELVRDRAKGYIFLQAVDGTTGERESVDTALSEKIDLLHKQIPDVSICTGFGVSVPRHCREMIEMGADGVIVGSLLVKKLISTSLRDTGRLIKELKTNLQ